MPTQFPGSPSGRLPAFHGAVVLITGAARGIGRACAEAFAAAGARVVVNYRSSADEAQEVAAALGEKAVAAQADVSDESAIAALFDRTEAAFGTPSVLINNAGIVNREKFPDLSASTFLETLRVNTVGPYLVAREFALRLGDRNGSIVNIGSMRAFQPTTPDYSASKAALHNLTVSLAKSLAPRIRVNAVAPGFTDTDMHAGNRSRLEAEGARSLLQRYSIPGDIADAVLFLASDQARSITGQVLLVDNGRTLAD